MKQQVINQAGYPVDTFGDGPAPAKGFAVLVVSLLEPETLRRKRDPASADRVCHKVCNEGFCRTTCVQRNDRLYMHESDRDYYHHRRPGVELHGPGVGVDIGR
jgi:hypothetical protein